MADAQMLVSIVGQQTVTPAANAAASSLGMIESAAQKGVGALTGLASAALKATAAVAAIGAGAAVAGMASSINVAKSFEQQISAVAAVSGATAAELKTLSDLALQLGKDTSFSATEAAQGLEELVKAGVSLSDIMGGAAKASLDLAAAGGVSVADAAEIAANALNVFNLSGKDMAMVANTIAGAANASAISVNDYKFSLASSGAAAKLAGVDFRDLSTAIALMGQSGIKGSDAGTSLKTMFLNLQPSTKAQKEAFKELGLITESGANAFFDATGKAKSLAEISGILQNATKHMTQQQKLATLEVLFGSDAIRAAAILTEAGAEGFNNMAAAMGNVAASDVAETRLDNLAGSLEKLAGTWETVRIKIGQPFLPILKRAVDELTGALNDAEPAISAYADAAAAWFDGFLTRGRQAMPAMLAMGSAALTMGRNLMSMAQGALPRVVNEFERLRRLFISGGGASGLLGGLDRVRATFRDLTPVSVTLGRVVADNVVATFTFLSQRVLPPVLSILTQTAGTVERTLLPAFAATGAVMRGIFGDTLDWLARTVWPPFLSIVEQTSDFFTSTILPTLPAVGASLRTALGETVEWLATDVWPKFSAAATVAWQFISEKVAPALPGIAQTIRSVLGGALEWIGNEGWPMLTRGAQSVATAFEEVRKRAVPIIKALFEGDIKTAIAGAGAAFSEFATLATRWLSEQAAKINWAGVWSAARNVTADMARWFVPLATQFVTWIGAQVASVNWASVWSQAKDVVLGMAQWFATVGGQIATWVGDKVAAIDWGSVWGRAVNVVQGMMQWFVPLVNDFAVWIGDRVAAIDWAAVWARGVDVTASMAQWFVALGADLTTWIGDQVGAINWPGVWAKVKDLTPAMQTAFTQAAAGINWADVIIRGGANSAARQLGEGFNALVSEIDWAAVGEHWAKQMFGGSFQDALKGGWKLLSPNVVLFEPMMEFIRAVDWDKMAGELGTLIATFLQTAWDQAWQRFKPQWPSWFPMPGANVPGSGVIQTPSGTPRPMPSGAGVPWQSSGGNVMAAPGTSLEDALSTVAMVARQQGADDEQIRALQAIVRQEGGYTGTVGDSGQSFGPFQFHERGQLPGFAEWLKNQGIEGDPRQHAMNIALATQYATTGYLGNTLRQGQSQGLYGATLAEYGQRYGQRSVSPELVRNRYSDEIVEGSFRNLPMNQSAASPAARMAITQTQQQWSQMASDANEICGPYLASLFASAVGRPPTADEARAIAQKMDMYAVYASGKGSGILSSARFGDYATRLIQELNPGTAASVQQTPFNMQDNAGVRDFAAAQLAGGAPLVGFNAAEHYFGATEFDPSTGKFRVGGTGLSLAGGSEWMTVEEMEAKMGQITAVISLLGVESARAQQAVDPIPPALQQVANASAPAASGLTATAEALPEVAEAAGQTEESVTQMAAQALTSVTHMGDGIMTVITDTAGNTTTTMTDLAGNVTSQITQMADGTVLTFGDMTNGILTSTTNLGDGVMTVVQDMSGNYITTITDLAGNVVNQYVQMADGASTHTALMAQTTAEQTTAMHDGTITTIADMVGQSSGFLTALGDTSKEQFGAVSTAASSTAEPIGAVSESLSSIEPPDAGPIVSAFGQIRSAARDTTKELERVRSTIRDISEASKGGSKSGSGDTGLGKRASGGPVGPGMWLVGEQGPELLSLSAGAGYVYNAGQTRTMLDGRGGSDGGIDYDRLQEAIVRSVAAQRPINLIGTSEELAAQLRRQQRQEQTLLTARRG